MPEQRASAAELLQAWLMRTKTPASTLARAVGCSGGRISQILVGHGRPSPELAAAIARFTRGAVPALAWFAVAAPQKRRAAR